MIEYTVRVYDYGDKEWFLNGKLHREDGPAIEYANGDKLWLLNGEYHRVDGPAVEYADGHKTWWLNGERHRVDGPAIEYVNGDKSWYLNGEKLTESQFNALQKTSCNGKVVEIDGVKYKLQEIKK